MRRQRRFLVTPPQDDLPDYEFLTLDDPVLGQVIELDSCLQLTSALLSGLGLGSITPDDTRTITRRSRSTDSLGRVVIPMHSDSRLSCYNVPTEIN